MACHEGPRPLVPEQLGTEVERLFEELIHHPWGGRSEVEQAWSPQLDLYETPDAFILEVDLPGVKHEDVSVMVQDSEIILHGQRECECVMRQGNVYRRERRAGEFTRRVPLSAPVARTRIRAEFDNGVFRVTIPKLRPEETPRR